MDKTNLCKRRKFESKKRPSRRRRGGCVPSREGAVGRAVPSRAPHGSAAGAGGARGAGRNAAAPEARRRPALGSPALRLPCLALALPDLLRAPRHAAARPLRPRHGARRGGGAAMAGEGTLVQGALRLAAAAVPRLDGCFEGWDEKAGRAHMVTSQFLQQPFLSLIVVTCCLDANFILLWQVHV